MASCRFGLVCWLKCWFQSICPHWFWNSDLRIQSSCNLSPLRCRTRRQWELSWMLTGSRVLRSGRHPADVACRFISESAIDAEMPMFDLAFSHEVFSLLPDLETHADVVRRLLAPNGVYYSAFGWHGDNPHSSRQAKIRNEKGLPFHPHSLDAVAETFHRAGFEVGYKRLPMPYFMIYEPTLVNRRFGSVSEMIACLQDHKVLFSFRKGGGEHGASLSDSLALQSSCAGHTKTTSRM